MIHQKCSKMKENNYHKKIKRNSEGNATELTIKIPRKEK